VRFWDTSAIGPLLVDQPRSNAAAATLAADESLMVWWATPVECASAIGRLEREGRLAPEAQESARDRLEVLRCNWVEIEPGNRLRDIAIRLLRTHPLRGADAFQLAAAIVAADGEPRSLPFVTLDARLALAASREGFPVIEPA
jgi:predicted nucleic acid-binding protein